MSAAFLRAITRPPADSFTVVATLGTRIAALVAEENGLWPSPDHG